MLLCVCWYIEPPADSRLCRNGPHTASSMFESDACWSCAPSRHGQGNCYCSSVIRNPNAPPSRTHHINPASVTPLLIFCIVFLKLIRSSYDGHERYIASPGYTGLTCPQGHRMLARVYKRTGRRCDMYETGFEEGYKPLNSYLLLLSLFCLSTQPPHLCVCVWGLGSTCRLYLTHHRRCFFLTLLQPGKTLNPNLTPAAPSTCAVHHQPT
jgi:hypothetical protein